MEVCVCVCDGMDLSVWYTNASVDLSEFRLILSVHETWHCFLAFEVPLLVFKFSSEFSKPTTQLGASPFRFYTGRL